MLETQYSGTPTLHVSEFSDPKRAARTAAENPVRQICSRCYQQDSHDSESGARAPSNSALHVYVDAVGDRAQLDARHEHDCRRQLDTRCDERNEAAGDQAAGDERRGNLQKGAKPVGAQALRRLLETYMNLLEGGVACAHGVWQAAHRVSNDEDKPG